MLNWEERKKLFLSDYFLRNKINSDLLKAPVFEEPKSRNKNKLYKTTTPWDKLVNDSKKFQVLIVPGPLETYPCGFIVENEIAQNLFDSAFQKTFINLITTVDYDEETLVFNMIEFILSNKLYKKSLYDVVKKLRTLNADMLPYEF